MKRYLYLSLTPEALIASMLPPEDFGKYLAVGTKKRTRGQAIFFEINPNFESNYFNLDDIEKRCIPNKDGSPKRSKYLAIYRVLEHVPLNTINNLYLVTDDGRVLEIKKKEYTATEEDGELHLYQQLAPVNPIVVSKLNPIKFCKYLTATEHPVSVPKIAFFELILNGLADDPQNAPLNNLPYSNVDHLRDCLIGLKEKESKPNKTVIRKTNADVMFRTVKNGLFVGDNKQTLYFPLPDKSELEGKYYAWWKSALTQGFNY
jgi:hypothetical protein